MNQVEIKASVLINPEKKVVSDSGRSASVILAGVDELSGKSFYIPAFFCGDGLEAFLEAGQSAIDGTRKRPLVMEGVGTVVTDTFRGKDGKKVILNRIKIATAPKFASSSLKMVEDSKGQMVLAKASVSAEFTGELVRDTRRPGKFGQMVLLKEPVRGGAYVFARIPAELPITAYKGDQVSLEGRVTRLYPRGTDNPGEIGFFANSIAADEGDLPSEAAFDEEGNLPF